MLPWRSDQTQATAKGPFHNTQVHLQLSLTSSDDDHPLASARLSHLSLGSDRRSSTKFTRV